MSEYDYNLQQIKNKASRSEDEAFVIVGGAYVPQHTYESLIRYMMNRVQPGGCLTDILAGNLFGAISHADQIHQKYIADIVKFIYNNLPCGIWGCAESVERHLAGSDT